MRCKVTKIRGCGKDMKLITVMVLLFLLIVC